MAHYSLIDYSMMRRALALAEQARYTASPNPCVGCVITSREGDILGEGLHWVAGEAHAEITALKDLSASQLEGATLYVTLEPCSHQGRTPPCAEAIEVLPLARVVVAMQDPNPRVAGSGIARLREAGLAVDVGLLEDEAVSLNRGFCKRMSEGRPLIRCKMAMSLDGRTAMANGESRWVTGPAARLDVQRWRARSCAIVTGAGTVLSDDPAMTVRLEAPDYPPNQAVRQPLRVIVDSRHRVTPEARIAQQPGRTVFAHAYEGATPLVESDSEPPSVWWLPYNNSHVDLHALAQRLSAEECNEVLVESGPELAGAFLRAGLVDELVIYLSAKLLGSDARPLFQLPLTSMAAQLPLLIDDIRAVGSDWRIIARPDTES